MYLLNDLLTEFSIRCWNYCLMPNHYHLTIQPELPNLSHAIRRLNGAYGLWWNQRHGRVGHVFQGRFKDQVVDREQYLVALSRYVVMNPVRAGLVQHAEDWRWSSYRATAGFCSAPPFLDTESTLELFGGRDQEDRRTRFVAAISEQEADTERTERIRSNQRILGPSEFKKAIEVADRRGLRSSSERSDPSLTPV
jgi:REP element-mobilizing transposase RayT